MQVNDDYLVSHFIDLAYYLSLVQYGIGKPGQRCNPSEPECWIQAKTFYKLDNQSYKLLEFGFVIFISLTSTVTV